MQPSGPRVRTPDFDSGDIGSIPMGAVFCVPENHMKSDKLPSDFHESSLVLKKVHKKQGSVKDIIWIKSIMYVILSWINCRLIIWFFFFLGKVQRPEMIEKTGNCKVYKSIL